MEEHALHLAIRLGPGPCYPFIGYSEDGGGSASLKRFRLFSNELLHKDEHSFWIPHALEDGIFGTFESLKSSGFEPVSFSVFGFSSDFVLLDRSFQSIGSYSWRDRTAERTMPELFSIVSEEEIFRLTGQRLDPSSALCRLFWLSRTHPELLEKAQLFLFLPDYCSWLVTRQPFADPATLSLAGLADINTGKLNSALLKRLGLPEHIFPPGLSYGAVLPYHPLTAPDSYRFVPPYVASPGYEMISSLMAVPAGAIYLHLGCDTAFCGLVTDEPPPFRRAFESGLSVFPLPGSRFFTASRFTGTIIYDRLRDEMQGPTPASLFEILSAAVPDTGIRIKNESVYLRNPYSIAHTIPRLCAAAGREYRFTTPYEIASVILYSLLDDILRAIRALRWLFGEQGELLFLSGPYMPEFAKLIERSASCRTVLQYEYPAEAGSVMFQELVTGKRGFQQWNSNENS